MLLAAVLLVGSVGCSSKPSVSEATPVVSVQVALATRGPLQQWIRSQGVLYPLHQAIITPKVSAPVKQFFVQRGDRVHAGEQVATLENKDLVAAAEQAQGQLEAAEAAYATATVGTIPAEVKKAQLDVAAAKKAAANAQRIYTNNRDMYRQGAIARNALEQAAVAEINANNAYELAQQHLQALEQRGGHQQALKAARGQLTAAQGRAAAAEAMLGYSKITSPIDGVVTDRPMYPGELATPASPLMTIMDLDHVVVHAPLPADQARLLKVGDQATIAVPGSGVSLPARVTVVSPATDPGSTTIQVWVEAQNPRGELRPGTSAQVSMLARTLPRALTVPADAILTDATGQASVMVVGADHRAHQTDVTLGVRAPDRVQVLSGITAGQLVVTVGAYGLPDQAVVSISGRHAPPATSKPAGSSPNAQAP